MVRKVNCWGFRDAAAAQEAVLKKAVNAIREKVDVWGIRSLPEGYIRSLSSASKVADLAIAFLRSSSEPVEQLRRLSPVLQSFRARLVVVIEDVDRNETGFGASHIQALLYRFREVEELSFILSAGSGANIDFAKLCDHQEDLLPLDRDVVLKVISTTLRYCLSRFPVDINTSEEADFFAHRDASQVTGTYYWYWFAALPELLLTPRLLKSALRRMVTSWEQLHGEVDLNELLICSTLRVAAPGAFDFFRSHFSALQQNSSTNSFAKRHVEAANKVLTKEWKTVCAKASFSTEAAARLLRALLPSRAI